MISDQSLSTSQFSLPQTMDISVLGAGQMGSALAARLAGGGARVWLGSRDPGRMDSLLVGVNVVTGVEAVKQGRIVIIAVQPQFHAKLPLGALRPGTVLVDCSNRNSPCREGKSSHAEDLAKVVPSGVSVVKGLNTLDVSDLSPVSAGSYVREVPLASDNPHAKAIVSDLVVALGHRPVDRGRLKEARAIENIPLALFPRWRYPLVLSLALWLLIHLNHWLRTLLCSHGVLLWTAERISASIFDLVNMTCSSHSLILLSAAHLPSVLHDYILLVRGTKYTLLPSWLARWLGFRDNLIQLLFVSASAHGWLGSMIPDVRRKDSAYLPAGVLSYLSLLLLCLLLHPALSRSLSRRESLLLRPLLSWTSLLLATIHCILAGWSSLTTFACLPTQHQLPLLLPAFTLFLQLPLSLPWIRNKLKRMRRGYVYSGLYAKQTDIIDIGKP